MPKGKIASVFITLKNTDWARTLETLHPNRSYTGKWSKFLKI